MMWMKKSTVAKEMMDPLQREASDGDTSAVADAENQAGQLDQAKRKVPVHCELLTGRGWNAAQHDTRTIS